jgi:hypothetical protein
MMSTQLELLGGARAADLERERRHRRLAAVADTCRRWVLGILPLDRPCTERTTC